MTYEKIEEIIGYSFNNLNILKQIIKLKEYDYNNPYDYLEYDIFNIGGYHKDNLIYLRELGKRLIGAEVKSYLTANLAISNENGIDLLLDSDFINGYASEIASKDYLVERLKMLKLYKDDFGFGGPYNFPDECDEDNLSFLYALIAGAYIDSGYNMDILRGVVKRIINPEYYLLYKTGVDYIKRLESWSKRCNYINPQYEVVDEDDGRVSVKLYLDNPGLKSVNKDKIFYLGYGDSYDEACMSSARVAFIHLRYMGVYIDSLLDVAKEDLIHFINKSDLSGSINKLVDKRLLSNPLYKAIKLNGRYYCEISILESVNKIIGISNDSFHKAKAKAKVGLISFIENEIGIGVLKEKKKKDLYGFSYDDDELPF